MRIVLHVDFANKSKHSIEFLLPKKIFHEQSHCIAVSGIGSQKVGKH